MTDAAIASLGNKAVVTGVTTTGIGWMTASNIAAIGGLLVAIIGCAVNIYYGRKRAQRERELHDLELQIKRRDLARNLPEWSQRPTNLIPDDGN